MGIIAICSVFPDNVNAGAQGYNLQKMRNVKFMTVSEGEFI